LQPPKAKQDSANGAVLLAPLPCKRKPATAKKPEVPKAYRPFSGASKKAVRGMGPMIRIALYQPDIAQNTGTILRLCACLGLEAHIIEPAGFPVSDRHFRRAGMDYLDQVTIVRHVDWASFESWRRGNAARLILFTTVGTASYLAHQFRDGDVLLFGRESAGVPQDVHQAADARLIIPLREGMRSLNVAMSVAMAAGEALRQTGGMPSHNISS
jgi:tRNA (cytidine/uridine-2'-O-)-methyltransferase